MASRIIHYLTTPQRGKHCVYCPPLSADYNNLPWFFHAVCAEHMLMGSWFLHFYG